MLSLSPTGVGDEVDKLVLSSWIVTAPEAREIQRKKKVCQDFINHSVAFFRKFLELKRIKCGEKSDFYGLLYFLQNLHPFFIISQNF